MKSSRSPEVQEVAAAAAAAAEVGSEVFSGAAQAALTAPAAICPTQPPERRLSICAAGEVAKYANYAVYAAVHAV